MNASTFTHPAWQPVFDKFPQLEVVGPHSYRRNNAAAEPVTARHFLLQDTAVLQLSGPDAMTFLQGQLTVDTENLANHGSVFAAHCNPKGRINANFFLHKVDAQTFLLLLPRANLEIASKALGKYAVFSKVAIEDVTAQFMILGCAACDDADTGDYHIAINSELSLLLLNWERSQQIETLLSAVDASCVAGSAEWQQLLSAHGYVLVLPETSGEFIPQMLNMDLLDGISFDKGCYTGQEVIARLKYRGEVKRRSFRFGCHLTQQVQITDLPVTGQKLYDEQKRNIGAIASVVALQEELCGIAVLKLDPSQMPATVYTAGSEAQHTDFALQITPELPPYAINNKGTSG